MSSTKTVVTLLSSKDWDKWHKAIKTASMEVNVWDFVNPKLEGTQRKILVQPLKPTFDLARGGQQGTLSSQESGTIPSSLQSSNNTGVAYGGLTESEKEVWKMMWREYLAEKKVYEEQEQGLQEIREKDPRDYPSELLALYL